MPRDIGTGLYHYPEGTPGNPAQTIFSTRYNTFINDLANTLNQSLPVNMGGTGGTSAIEARDNLDAEAAMQEVTSYATHAFEAGSFFSLSGATDSPFSGHSFLGTFLGVSFGVRLIEAYDISVNPPVRYARRYNGTSWDAWVNEGVAMDTRYVNTTGDTMSGDLAISKNGWPMLALDNVDGGSTGNVIKSSRFGAMRWDVRVLNSDPEVGGNSGGNFDIYRYDDAGTTSVKAFSISRGNGNVAIAGLLNVAGDVATGHGRVVIDDNGGAFTSGLALSHGSVKRWEFVADNNLSLVRHNDAGAIVDAPVIVNRATGKVTLGGAAAIGGVLTVAGDAATGHGRITVDDGGGALTSGYAWKHGGVTRWEMLTTSDLDLVRYNDAGATVDIPINVNRATGFTKLQRTNITMGGSALPTYFGSMLNIGSQAGVAGIGIHNTDAATWMLHFENPSAAQIGTIAASSTTTTYNTTSDERLKEDLQPVTTAGQIIDATNVYDFRWKSTQERAYGIIAQQAINVYPAAITHLNDSWGVDYSKYVPILLQEAKSLRQHATDAREKIERLEARLAAGSAAALDVAVAVSNAMNAIPDNFNATNFAAVKIQLDALTQAFAAMLQAQAPP
jgi:hypothetical protein